MIKFRIAILLGALLFLGASELEAAALPGVPATAEEPAKAEPIVQGGLLGAISSSIDDVQDKLDLNEHLVDAWRLRADRAADEVDRLVNHPSNRSGWSVAGDFLMLSGVWLGAFRPADRAWQSVGQTPARRPLVTHAPAQSGSARLSAAVHAAGADLPAVDPVRQPFSASLGRACAGVVSGLRHQQRYFFHLDAVVRGGDVQRRP